MKEVRFTITDGMVYDGNCCGVYVDISYGERCEVINTELLAERCPEEVQAILGFERNKRNVTVEIIIRQPEGLLGATDTLPAFTCSDVYRFDILGLTHRIHRATDGSIQAPTDIELAWLRWRIDEAWSENDSVYDSQVRQLARTALAEWDSNIRQPD